MDITSPVRAFLSLRSAGHVACLLESADGPSGLARYSFIGVDPVGSLCAEVDGWKLNWRGAQEQGAGTPIDGLRRALDTCGQATSSPELPPFTGGWIGYLGYDLVRALEPTVPEHPGAQENQDATAYFAYFGDIVCFDHVAQRIMILTDCINGEEADVVAAQGRAVQLALDVYGPADLPGPVALKGAEPTTRFGDTEFEDAVSSLRSDIGQGEIFQAVPSRCFSRAFDGDPFTFYRSLRLTNPAPHMFFFEAPDLTLVGSSPERLVSVQAGRIQTRPIAGTRPRGANVREDERLGVELQRDKKERAEHDMLVDLARNDLGRVARVGTVEVIRYASLERFSRVQHLVSVVEADLRAGCDALDALASTFPAGTVSGAPKIRAMQLIADLEPQPRGTYAGAFGYVDRQGNLDMAIIIRTLVVRGDEVRVQAGAGVVHASDPTRERVEVDHKCSAMLEAVDLASSEVFGDPNSVVSDGTTQAKE